MAGSDSRAGQRLYTHEKTLFLALLASRFVMPPIYPRGRADRAQLEWHSSIRVAAPHISHLSQSAMIFWGNWQRHALYVCVAFKLQYTPSNKNNKQWREAACRRETVLGKECLNPALVSVF